MEPVASESGRPRVVVRDETPEDITAIHEVNLQAFGQPLEARLVDMLRANRGVLLSLVAELDGRIVGHILYSPAQLVSGEGPLDGAALGPMGVHPEFQRQGVGSRLISEGNDRIRAQGWPFIIVLGHPEYYPRFGFLPADYLGVQCPWDVPEEVFMVLPLDVARRERMRGMARYRDEFTTVT